MTVERDWFWFWFWFYYALWLASVFTLVLVLWQSSENRSISAFLIGSNPLANSSWSILIQWFTCQEVRLISGIFCFERRLLGQKWTKKWRSWLSEDEIAQFLTKTAQKKWKTYCSMDVNYFLCQGHSFEERLRGSKFVRNLEKFWMDDTRIFEFGFCVMWRIMYADL